MEDDEELAPEGTVANPVEETAVDPSMAVRRPPTDEMGSFKHDYANYQIAAAQNRQKRFEAAQNFIQQNYTGPTQAERLFALSRALLSPRRMPGFAGTMDNMSQMLAQTSAASREAQTGRNKALFELQQQYGAGEESAQDKALQTRLELLKLSGGNKPKMVWSENMGRFNDANSPAPTEDYIQVGGHELVQYTDGTYRLANDDGSQDVYRQEGSKLVKVGTQSAGGQ